MSEASASGQQRWWRERDDASIKGASTNEGALAVGASSLAAKQLPRHLEKPGRGDPMLVWLPFFFFRCLRCFGSSQGCEVGTSHRCEGFTADLASMRDPARKHEVRQAPQMQGSA